MKKMSNHKELLENEWYHVRHSGEIPEVALHSSIHYLTEDIEGPGLELGKDELNLLNDAALQRYQEIIIRDISPENRDTSMYRGVLRAICNWRRFKRFCVRHQLNHAPIKEEVRERFITFLQKEVTEVSSRFRSGSINCTFEELHSFAVEMDVELSDWSEELEKICSII